MCHSTANKREVPGEGKRPPQCYEVKLLTLQDRIAAAVGSRAAVVTRRCACVWCPAKPGMGKQCLIAPALHVRAPLSVRVALRVVPVVSQLARLLPCLLVMPVRVPVRGCARALTPKPCEGFARVVPTQPDPSPVPLAAHAFSCPFVASGSWRSGYVPRMSGMIVHGALTVQPSLHFLAHSGFRRLRGSHKVLVPRGTPYERIVRGQLP